MELPLETVADILNRTRPDPGTPETTELWLRIVRDIAHAAPTHSSYETVIQGSGFFKAMPNRKD